MSWWSGAGSAGLRSRTRSLREGVGVTVLEATTRVRGPRARREHAGLGREGSTRTSGWKHVLLDAGAHIAPVWKQYIEGIGEVGDIPMAMMVPGIPGTLNLRHPVACQALLDAAAAAGATVVRGVRDVSLAARPSPTVSYAMNGQPRRGRARHSSSARTAAASTVRKQAGITLDRQAADQLHRRAAPRRPRRRP